MRKKKRMVKGILKSALVMGMFVGVIAFSGDRVQAEESYGVKVESGTCGTEEDGNNVEWTSYDSDNAEDILVISGKGEIPEGAFCNKTTITKVIFKEESKITAIGESAFYLCSSLENITIPNTVTSIGKWSFCSTKITNIAIPNSVTEIGESAFWGCSSLTSIIIPDSVTKIGEFAFNNCNSLEVIYYPVAKKTDVEKLDAVEVYSLTQVSYKINDEEKIDITIDNLSSGTTSIIFPGEISGKEISTISTGEGVDISNLQTIYYPSNADIDGLGDTTNCLRASYQDNGDGTVSITIENILESTTEISIPETVNGKKVVSLSFDNEVDGEKFKIECQGQHYPKSGKWTITDD